MKLRTLYTTRLTAGLMMAVTASTAFADPKCTCRYKGQNFQLGQVLCILGKMQRCEMTLNNSTWKVVQDFCPQSNFSPVPAKTLTASLPAASAN